MGMGNQNKNSDDDECGTIPTERGRSDVLPKLKDNIINIWKVDYQ